MPSSVMLRRVALVRTDVSEERSAYLIRVTRIGELRTKLVTASVVPMKNDVFWDVTPCDSYKTRRLGGI
jgi:DNA-binding TFAR19-related protein (PDSD5 family)